MPKTIGYIGLGVLGSAMVPNLIESGFEVIGYDVRTEVLDELGKLGMQVASSPKDAAERSDVVVSCLPSIEVLLDVFGGEDGIDKADKAGQIVIEIEHAFQSGQYDFRIIQHGEQGSGGVEVGRNDLHA